MSCICRVFYSPITDLTHFQTLVTAMMGLFKSTAQYYTSDITCQYIIFEGESQILKWPTPISLINYGLLMRGLCTEETFKHESE